MAEARTLGLRPSEHMSCVFRGFKCSLEWEILLLALKMIQSSFIILPGISSGKEKLIHEQGIKTWDDFVKVESIKGISKKRKIIFNHLLIEAKKKLFKDDLSFFKSKETWRLFDFYKDECCYLDIEGDVNIIGLFDGYETKTLVQGINLDYNLLHKELSKYKILITFNGSSYDLPKLNNFFQKFPKIIHIDLKGLCSKVGLKGGLKKIEKQLNLKRPEYLYGSPADIWRAWKASGNREYLEKLVEYNEEDVINLKPIMEYCNMKLKK